MPISESELRGLLVARSATPPVVIDRLGQVHGRIARHRHRQRLATVAAVVVAVLAATLGVVMPSHLASHRTSAPAGNAAAPQFYDGGRLIATTTLLSPAAATASVTFVPDNWQLSVRISCEGGGKWPADLVASVGANGHADASMSCFDGDVSSVGAGFGDDQKYWSDEGVQLGKPSRLSVTLGTDTPAGIAQPASPIAAADRPTGRVVVAVYERIPLADYVFPKAPAKLAGVEVPDGSPSLDARKVGANGRWTLQVAAGSNLELTAGGDAPGSLSFVVDGVQVGLCELWDYSEQSCSITLQPAALADDGVHVNVGQLFGVDVVATRFGGPDWAVVVLPAPTSSSSSSVSAVSGVG